jgi:hypothetical protein
MMPLNMITLDESGDPETPDPPPALPPQGPSEPTPKPAEKPNENARMVALLTGNAERMARRMAAGKPPTAEALADALAISAEQARVWLHSSLATPLEDVTEAEYKEQLMALGATA